MPPELPLTEPEDMGNPENHEVSSLLPLQPAPLPPPSEYAQLMPPQYRNPNQYAIPEGYQQQQPNRNPRPKRDVVPISNFRLQETRTPVQNGFELSLGNPKQHENYELSRPYQNEREQADFQLTEATPEEQEDFTLIEVPEYDNGYYQLQESTPKEEENFQLVENKERGKNPDLRAGLTPEQWKQVYSRINHKKITADYNAEMNAAGNDPKKKARALNKLQALMGFSISARRLANPKINANPYEMRPNFRKSGINLDKLEELGVLVPRNAHFDLLRRDADKPIPVRSPVNYNAKARVIDLGYPITKPGSPRTS